MKISKIDTALSAIKVYRIGVLGHKGVKEH